MPSRAMLATPVAPVAVITAIAAALTGGAAASDAITAIDRTIETDCFVLVLDDPVSDEQDFQSSRSGLIEAQRESFATQNFSSARGTGLLESDIEGDAFEAFGIATAQLYIQGLAEANAASTMRLTASLGTGGRFVVDLLELFVDDAFGGDFAFDGPAEAAASLVVTDLASGDVAYAQQVVLGDDGAFANLLFEDRFAIDLGPGTFELVVTAQADDATAGPEEIEGSFAVAGMQISGFVDACPADFDGDGAVAFGDLLAVLAAFGDPGLLPTDLDLDGVVDFDDLLTVLASFGPCL